MHNDAVKIETINVLDIIAGIIVIHMFIHCLIITKICELSPPPTSAIYASSRMSGQTNSGLYASLGLNGLHICVTRPQWVTTKCCHPLFTVSTDCSSWLFHILVPCPSSSITLISLIPACIGSVRNYHNPIHCAYHSVISLLLSGSLWSHLWHKSRTKLDETLDSFPACMLPSSDYTVS